ncbi:MAG: SDR family oxidoreductase [Bdellovibrionales bacterium]|nr:SDR family oxidoreductase [Bdellovibrionales bacterium]
MENIAILGASRGLGLELAKHLKSSANLFLVARNIESLKAEFSAPHTLQPFDFTHEAQWENLFQQLKSHNAQRIVYCAGGGPYGDYAQKAWKDHMWAYNLNFLFPAFLLHSCLKESKLFQQFIYVGSDICEARPDPKAASYSASKHAMKGLLTSIQSEAPELDVRLFSPGYMDTSMLTPNAKPRQSQMSLLSPELVAKQLWQWAQSPQGDRHKILPSI